MNSEGWTLDASCILVSVAEELRRGGPEEPFAYHPTNYLPLGCPGSFGDGWGVGFPETRTLNP